MISILAILAAWAPTAKELNQEAKNSYGGQFSLRACYTQEKMLVSVLLGKITLIEKNAGIDDLIIYKGDFLQPITFCITFFKEINS